MNNKRKNLQSYDLYMIVILHSASKEANINFEIPSLYGSEKKAFRLSQMIRPRIPHTLLAESF